MARPSKDQDRILLAAGARLYPELGVDGLSVRRLAEAAGVNPAMVHYHFGNKEGFLRTLLQEAYEDLFARLPLARSSEGDTLARLSGALLTLARFVRDHRTLISRVWADARAGHAVALEFLRANAPRHLQLLAGLLSEAEQQGRLPPAPLVTRFTFLMGAVIAPLVIVGGVRDMQVLPPLVAPWVDDQVFSDAALQRRVDWALQALTSGV